MEKLSEYECNSCGYIVLSDETQKRPEKCPACRGNLSPVGEFSGTNVKEHECGNCQTKFYVPEKAFPPYKCVRCNYTLVTSPKRKKGERF